MIVELRAEIDELRQEVKRYQVEVEVYREALKRASRGR
jgi:hypothetical protein